MIARLGEPPAPPRVWSELFHEADRTHSVAYPPVGTTEEQITMLADARRQIWEMAERAPQDEQDDIRAMTQDLQSLENFLRNHRSR